MPWPVGEVKIIESDNYYYVVEKLELDPDGSELTAASRACCRR